MLHQCRRTFASLLSRGRTETVSAGLYVQSMAFSFWMTVPTVR
jgi:hypothetical protein